MDDQMMDRWMDRRQWSIEWNYIGLWPTVTVEHQWYHVSSLELDMIGIFTPWKSANTTNQAFLFTLWNQFNKTPLMEEEERKEGGISNKGAIPVWTQSSMRLSRHISVLITPSMLSAINTITHFAWMNNQISLPKLSPSITSFRKAIPDARLSQLLPGHATLTSLFPLRWHHSIVWPLSVQPAPLNQQLIRDNYVF